MTDEQFEKLQKEMSKLQKEYEKRKNKKSCIEEKAIENIKNNGTYIYVSQEHTILNTNLLDKMIFLLMLLNQLDETDINGEIMDLVKEYIKIKDCRPVSEEDIGEIVSKIIIKNMKEED